MPFESLQPGGLANLKQVVIDAPKPLRTRMFDPIRDVTPRYRTWLETNIENFRKDLKYERLVGTAAYCKLLGTHVDLSEDEIEKCAARAFWWMKRPDNQSYFAIQDFGSLAILGHKPPMDAGIRQKFRETLDAHVRGNNWGTLAEMAFYLAILDEGEMIDANVIERIQLELQFWRRPDVPVRQDLATNAAALRMLGKEVALTPEEWTRIRSPKVLETEMEWVVTDNMPSAALPAKLNLLAAEVVRMTPNGLELGRKKDEPHTIPSFPVLPAYAQSLPL